MLQRQEMERGGKKMITDRCSKKRPEPNYHWETFSDTTDRPTSASPTQADDLASHEKSFRDPDACTDNSAPTRFLCSSSRHSIHWQRFLELFCLFPERIDSREDHA